MDAPWNEMQWKALESSLRQKLFATSDEYSAWKRVTRTARRIMNHYTTSFFIVSRFVPPPKRDRVEVIYASVRYPDEVVDTFKMSAEQRTRVLNAWADDYEKALLITSLRKAMAEGINPLLAAFGKVVREAHIPPEHYRSFLQAMRMDIYPRPFETLDDLTESYVYGSAVVVGYFLTHVYGPSHPNRMPAALACARELAIALQLTNFARDVREDHRRGRVYLPQDMLRAAGADMDRLDDPRNRRRVIEVIRQIADYAELGYRQSEANIAAFNPDSQVAIKACIDVYRKLNQQIMASDDCILRRESVSAWDKFRRLPTKKYWLLPLHAAGAR